MLQPVGTASQEPEPKAHRSLTGVVLMEKSHEPHVSGVPLLSWDAVRSNLRPKQVTGSVAVPLFRSHRVFV